MHKAVDSGYAVSPRRASSQLITGSGHNCAGDLACSLPALFTSRVRK